MVGYGDGGMWVMMENQVYGDIDDYSVVVWSGLVLSTICSGYWWWLPADGLPDSRFITEIWIFVVANVLRLIRSDKVRQRNT